MTRKPVVVDTNVLVVSNGRDTHADLECQRSCTERLIAARNEELVLLDDHNLIIGEYQRHARPSGEPGLGDRFLVYLFDHQYSGERVVRVPINPNDIASRGFDELPSNTLKAGDRVFLAVAVVGNAPILNATDSDWSEQMDLLRRLQVSVFQLCPQHATRANEAR